MVGRWLLLVACASLTASCLRHTTYDRCQTDGDCAAAGVAAHCEADHACSVDDLGCPGSGHRYVPSAPQGAVCVEMPDGRPDSPVDTPPGPPDAPSAAGRECVKGGKRVADGTCAPMVCAKEPRCCSEQWDAACVRWAETLCDAHCGTMAFVGGADYGIVFRTDTWTPIWDDSPGSDAMTHGGYWADYDDDGDVDLATVGGRELHIYRDDGFDGTHLTLTPVYSKEWGQLGNNSYLDGRTGAWADFDGDGDLDLALGGFDGLVLIENQGGVFLNERVVFRQPMNGDTDAAPTPDDTTSLAWADIDGDHDLDLVVGRYYGPSLLFTNDGTGVLTQKTWNGPANGTESVQWCNLDGDPAPELVMSGASYLSIFKLTGTSVADDAQATHVQTADFVTETKCGDLDHDGDLDLFSAAWGTTVRAYRNGNQTLAGFSEAWRDGTNVVSQWGLDVGDINGDGKLDAVGAGNGFDTPTKVQPYLNASTNTNQNIAFTVPAPIGASINLVTHDVELAPLPAPP